MPPLFLDTSSILRYKYNGVVSFLAASGEIFQWSPPFQNSLSFKNYKYIFTFRVAEKMNAYYAQQ